MGKHGDRLTVFLYEDEDPVTPLHYCNVRYVKTTAPFFTGAVVLLELKDSFYIVYRTL